MLRPGMDEREVKLAVPPGFKLPELEGVSDQIVPGPVRSQHLNTVYYDTPQLRLARWGCSLRHREGEGWTVKLPPSSEGMVLIRPEHTFPGARGRPAPGAFDLLRAYVRTDPLSAVAHLRTQRRVIPLLDRTGRRVAEVVDDEVSVLDGRRVAGRFRELEVEVFDGVPAGALSDIVERLRAAGAGSPDLTPKYIRALGTSATQPPEVDVGALPADPAGADVIRATIAQSVTRLLRSDAGIRIGEDPEAVHQARVATRRLRSDLRTLRSLVDPEWRSSLRDELRWLGRLLGEVRDADVLFGRLQDRADSLPDGSGARPILDRLGRSRATARDALLEALRSDRYVSLLNRLVTGARDPALDPASSEAARKILPRILSGPWAHLDRSVSGLSSPPTNEELHDIRIWTKRFRYAAEASSDVLGKRVTTMGKAAARLQDVLGQHQDAVVARAWLVEAAGRSGGRPAFVAGELAMLESGAAEEARREWPKAWRSLVRRHARSGV